MAEQSPTQLLNSWNWQDRQKAVHSMEKSGQQSSTGSLSDVLLSDDSMYVRLAAARALGKVGDAGAVGALVNAYHQDDYDMIRKSSIWSLGEIGERFPKETVANILPVLQEAITDGTYLAERDVQIKDLAKVSMDRISKAVGADISLLAASGGGAVGTAGGGSQIIEVNITDENRARLEAAAARRAEIAPYDPSEDVETSSGEGGAANDGAPRTIEELLAQIGSTASASSGPIISQEIIEVNITDENRARLESAAKRRAEAASAE